MSDASTRSRMLMIALPGLLALLLLLSAGTLVVAGYVGRPATGVRAVIEVRSACAADWATLLETRALGIGLGEPVLSTAGDVVTVTATLPGNADDRESVPALLTAPGQLTVHVQDGETVATQADLAETRLSMSYMGRATVTLRPSDVAWARIRALDPEAVLVATLDGESVILGEIRRVGRDDELHVQPSLEKSADELRMVADWAIVLASGPGPCAVTQASVRD